MIEKKMHDRNGEQAVGVTHTKCKQGFEGGTMNLAK
jgi:hypothetical protein